MMEKIGGFSAGASKVWEFGHLFLGKFVVRKVGGEMGDRQRQEEGQRPIKQEEKRLSTRRHSFQGREGCLR